MSAGIRAAGAIGSIVACGLALPAAAEGGGEASSNPYAVIWSGESPAVLGPVSFELRDEPDTIVQAVPFRMPVNTARPAPSIAPPVLPAGASFPQCGEDTACGDVAGRLGLRVRSGAEGVRLGALVRLGEGGASPAQRIPDFDTWRFFAAADAHALTWDFERNDGETVRVEEKTLVGDAQVGVARPLAGGDLALGFVHREVSYKGASRDEQFGGVTFVLSR